MRAQTSPYSVFLHLILVGLATTSLLLARQNRELRSAATPPPQESAFEVGSRLPDLEVVNLEGRAEALSFAGRDRQNLVFFFTTTCGACRENQENWRRLHDQLATSVDIVGVSLDGPSQTVDYAAEMDLPYRVVAVTDPVALAQALPISMVPETVLLDGEGSVVGSWLGILDESALSSLGAGT